MEKFKSVKIKEEFLTYEFPDDYKNTRPSEENKDTENASKKN